ncbi:hypothetical protein B0H15DRAFT_806805 [Mycena belliarum]|uniref:Uncharacterized protein n=1 Tax=Mycena belliarum TaxID=1033014 RepID=A0AAD6TQF7_9AGAR|nr:hypothetical protein B0H15DRAFT_806805 [Mycena belliae]
MVGMMPVGKAMPRLCPIVWHDVRRHGPADRHHAKQSDKAAQPPPTCPLPPSLQPPSGSSAHPDGEGAPVADLGATAPCTPSARPRDSGDREGSDYETFQDGETQRYMEIGDDGQPVLEEDSDPEDRFAYHASLPHPTRRSPSRASNSSVLQSPRLPRAKHSSMPPSSPPHDFDGEDSDDDYAEKVAWAQKLHDQRVARGHSPARDLFGR